MARFNCSNCEKDAKTGFNFCRQCGENLRGSYVPTNLAIARQGTDRFCGNCGKPVDKCKC